MKPFILLSLISLCPFFTHGQSGFSAIIQDAATHEPLAGATALIIGTPHGTSSDTAGILRLENVPPGEQIIQFSFVGYQTRRDTFDFPLPADRPIIIGLYADEEALEEVVVASTRSTRTITDEPTRVETITTEELEEKTTMNASNITLLLKESTGIQVQQTSVTSANANFRIQGLDGRYTQLLQNGFPLYSGFSSGLSLLQIPPLDLKRVEIIKGSSSTLYGGGAIAGLVNLITKVPTDEPELSLLVNATSAQGLDGSGFYARKWQKVGVTLFASHNRQLAYDPNKDNFSDIPHSRKYTVNPRLFFYFSNRTTASIGLNVTTEDRTGGYMDAIDEKSTAFYTERNQSARYTSQLTVDHRLSKRASLFIKNSFSAFHRKITVPDYRFGGRQWASFSEAGYAHAGEQTEWIAGVNLWTDRFTEDVFNAAPVRNYRLNTVGAFAQHTWEVSRFFILETGLRTDYQHRYGWFVLPKISALVKLSPAFTSRIGGGLGYKLPTIFTQESEEFLFRNVLPIDVLPIRPETSAGVNVDVNYKTTLPGAVTLSVNQLFFYTQLNQPLLLNSDTLAANGYQFENANGHVDAAGFETNLKATYQDFILFGGYSFTDTKRHYNQLETPIPLTARHRLNMTLMYEKEGKWRIGYEVFYTGKQRLNDNTYARDYWIQGVSVEKKWPHVSVFINFENFTDTRLSRWQPMYTGTVQQPQFIRDIYAPTDGRIINGGVKLHLYSRVQ